ncbi:MAG: hypothetical protein PHW46_05050 [Candidatus Omnitrophica bacterium]|nr:hypothetical protein [Candidatus Omnitrophota bacterium]
MAAGKTTKKEKAKKKIGIEDLLTEIQARFDAIEGKLDRVLSQSAGLSRMISTEHDPGFKTHATVTKKFPIPQDEKPRERKMFKAVCAECKKDCEVPFMPREGRPVYCKTCYSNRRKGNAPGNIPPREEIVAEIAKTLNINVAEPSKPKALKDKRSKPKKNKTKK